MTCRAIAALAAACGLTLACGVEPEAAQDVTGALVDEATFRTAAEVISGIDYLPFDYKQDGCFARAYYMSMELAARAVASNELFAIAPAGAPLRFGNITWSFHVAPMLAVGPNARDARHQVFDPALSTTPLADDEWVSKMRAGADTEQTRPELLFVPGSTYAGTQAEVEALGRLSSVNVDVPDFASLPPFAASDIQRACNSVHQFLTLEAMASDSPPPTETCRDGTCIDAAKEERLLSRTVALLSSLRAKGKVKEDAVFSADACLAAGF